MNITLEGPNVHCGKIAVGKPATTVSEFCQVVANNCLTGLSEGPIPDNVRWVVEKGDKAVYVVELQPELRRIKCHLGNHCSCEHCRKTIGTEAGTFTVATPYVVLLVPFNKNKMGPYPQIFYRKAPLKGLDDNLFITNLPNTKVSLEGGEGWNCIDGLWYLKNEDLSREEVLGEFANHIWSGEFNNEINPSNFHVFSDSNRDARLHSMAAWQKASLQEPKFVLKVGWIMSQDTVRDHIKRVIGPSPFNSKSIGNLMLKANQT